MSELTRLRHAYEVVEEPDGDVVAAARAQLLDAIESAERPRQPRRRRIPLLVAVALVVVAGGLLAVPALGLGSRLLALFDGEMPTGGQGAAWSPDGRKIAYSSNLDGDPEIYVMNADGSDPRRLARNGVSDSR